MVNKNETSYNEQNSTVYWTGVMRTDKSGMQWNADLGSIVFILYIFV